MSKLNEGAVEAAARVIYEVCPLHHTHRDGASRPLPYAKLIASADDTVRAETVRTHRLAIRAAISAFLAAPDKGAEG